MLFNSLVLAASLVVPLASASHGLSPRDLSLSHYRSFGRRSLPRSGRRVDRRQAGQATVKCDSRHTFSLCDTAGTCTAMGAVAAGTACENDAITWDSEGATDPPADSSTSEVAVTPPPTSEAVVVAPTKANLNVKGTATSADPTFSSASPTASASSTDSADDGDCDAEDDLTDDGSDDEGDCETDDVSAPEGTSTDSSSSSSSASPVTVIAAVKTTPKPTTASPTSTPAPEPTTSSAAAPAVSVPAVGDVSGIIGQVFTGGFATYYYQEGGTGACGQVHQDSDMIVAIQLGRYGTGSNNAPDCGRTVIVTNPANGKSVTAKVADACPGCKNLNSLDLSTGAFNAIADPALGVIAITWGFAS